MVGKKEGSNNDFWYEDKENGGPWTELGKARLVAGSGEGGEFNG